MEPFIEENRYLLRTGQRFELLQLLIGVVRISPPALLNE